MRSSLSLRVQVVKNEVGNMTVPAYEMTLCGDQTEVAATSTPTTGETSGARAELRALSLKLNNLLGDTAATSDEWESLLMKLELLLPNAIQDHLHQADSYLELHCQQSALPWELLAGLSHQEFVTRVQEPPVKIMSGVVSDSTKKVLIASQPHSISDWAEPVVASLQKKLSQKFEVVQMRGSELTKRNLFGALLGGEYSLVHLTCFLSATGFLLHDKELKFKDLKKLTSTTRPRLVVVHGITDAEEDVLERADRAARALLASGVPAVLISGWNPLPAKAKIVFSGLYEPKGDELMWQSLQRVKREQAGTRDPSRSHLSFFAYGDWIVALSQISPVNIETVQNAPTSRGGWQADYQLVVLDGPDKGAELPLFTAALANGRKISIGRPGALPVDLSLEDTEMENVAATLEKTSEGLVLSNPSGSPDSLKVNGLSVYSSVQLKGCDEIRMGQTCLRIEAVIEGESRGPSQLPEAERYELRVLSGQDQDEDTIVKLVPRVTLIGRQADCGLMLHDPSVSRHHMSLIPKDGSFFANGIGDAQVVVNGLPLREEKRLKHGDSIQLSPTTVLQFVDSRRS